MDDATGLAYAEILPDEEAASTTSFGERAVAWFKARHVTVERVMTDKWSAYVSTRFRDAVSALGARHVRTRPCRSHTNGKAERFLQTMLLEWAYARSYPTSMARSSGLPAFLDYYNRRRPHRALADSTPLSRLEPQR